MSAWPEAIYIINKLNKALENTTTFNQDVLLIDDINRKINNANIKFIQGGQAKETEEEYRLANNITTSTTIMIKSSPEDIGKELAYSNMSQQSSDEVVTAVIEIPDSNLDDFIYMIDEDGNGHLLYILTDYTQVTNFNTTPPSLNNNLDYSIESLLLYLQLQDQYLNEITTNMNTKLDNFLANNNLVNLAELVNSINSKMAIISETAPIATPTMPLSNYSVWLQITGD